MFAIQNIKTGKFLYGTDYRYRPPHQRTSNTNVLNVIDSEAARGDVVRLAATKAAALLITVYEGDGSGTGRQTAADSWQENRRTADYMDEIAAALPGWNVARFGRLIQATQKR